MTKLRFVGCLSLAFAPVLVLLVVNWPRDDAAFLKELHPVFVGTVSTKDVPDLPNYSGEYWDGETPMLLAFEQPAKAISLRVMDETDTADWEELLPPTVPGSAGHPPKELFRQRSRYGGEQTILVTPRPPKSLPNALKGRKLTFVFVAGPYMGQSLH